MDSGPTSQADVLENLVYRFEQAWQEGQRPQIDDFLPDEAALRKTVLVELAHVDLEFRVKAGEEARVEQYLGRFPEFDTGSDDALNLIVAEYQLRSRGAGSPVVDEFRDRFPEQWDRLEQRLTSSTWEESETLISPPPARTADDDTTVDPNCLPTPLTQSEGGDSSFRYKIVENHASGGLGDVFVARDEEVPRDVALKQLKPQFAHDPDSQVRFLREAEITGGLEHPGIVPVYGMGAYADGRPYYAMRFVRGGSLKDAVTRYHDSSGPDELAGHRSLKLRKLLTRFIEVCHAIDYAHSRGVVHRDIKPSNIMLGKYGETLVVDWGLAKPIGRSESRSRPLDEATMRPQSGSGSAATQRGSAVGTPAYMSPEQACGYVDTLTAATDVYSLGATLYEILTGQPPQTSQELTLVLNRVSRGDFPPPRSIQPDVPAGLESICLKAMALLPEDRYQSAGALAADVENWLADEPVAAHRESVWDRSRRWMRRHRTIVSSATVAAVLLTAAGVASFIAWDRAQHEDRMRRERLQATILAAENSAIHELQNDRYSSALGFVETALVQLEERPELGELRSRLQNRRDHIQRLDDFHRLAAQAEQSAMFENNREAISACRGALDVLAVFEHSDWWAHLPTNDLTPRQADRLQQRVYDQLILLTMFKGKSAILNFMSPTGGEECRELLNLSELVQRFRRAESIATLQDFANFRIGAKFKLPNPDFSTYHPQTAADNNAVGIMAWSLAQNPIMRKTILAGRDVDQNLTEVARKFFIRSAALDPDRYMTIATLGFINWQLKDFDAARQAYNQCIVLRPDNYFAYGLRAETFLDEARKTEDRRQKNVLLHAALQDAETARDLAPTVYFVHWYCGEVYREMGQISEAVPSYLQAIKLGKMTVNSERRLMNLHREAVQTTRARMLELLQAQPEKSEFRLLLATAELELENNAAAEVAAEEVLKLQPKSAEALAIRGTVSLRKRDYEAAQAYFQSALESDDENYRAAIGLGRVLENLDAPGAALVAFENCIEVAQTDWQRAAGELGRCASLIRLERFDEAEQALKSAIRYDPGCDFESLSQFAKEHQAAGVLETIESIQNPQLPDAKSRRFSVLPLLNGGFELGLSAYWGEPHRGKPTWWNRGGCRSSAEVSADNPHEGRYALHINHRSPAADGVFAETSQSVPATAGARYRVSLWARGDVPATGGIQVTVGEGNKGPVIDLSDVAQDWQQFSGKFTAKQDMVTVRIVSTSEGEVWLDDLRIELVEP